MLTSTARCLYDISDLKWIYIVYIYELDNYVKAFGTIHGDVNEAYLDRQVRYILFKLYLYK